MMQTVYRSFGIGGVGGEMDVGDIEAGLQPQRAPTMTIEGVQRMLKMRKNMPTVMPEPIENDYRGYLLYLSILEEGDGRSPFTKATQKIFDTAKKTARMVQVFLWGGGAVSILLGGGRSCSMEQLDQTLFAIPIRSISWHGGRDDRKQHTGLLRHGMSP